MLECMSEDRICGNGVHYFVYDLASHFTILKEPFIMKGVRSQNKKNSV